MRMNVAFASACFDEFESTHGIFVAVLETVDKTEMAQDFMHMYCMGGEL